MTEIHIRNERDKSRTRNTLQQFTRQTVSECIGVLKVVNGDCGFSTLT